MRVAVIDIGTNSTRLLVADVEGEKLLQVERQTRVTRLGHDLDRSGRLGADAIERVLTAARDYSETLSSLGSERTTTLATSAVRDAVNGDELIDEIRDRFGLEVDLLSGEREALLTYRGATHGRESKCGLQGQTLVIDIGGGSTEFIAGSGTKVTFHTSTRLGCVRQSERFLLDDPPGRGQLERLAAEAVEVVQSNVAGHLKDSTVTEAIAVAGTATSLAAIDQELDPYDPAKVHGYHISLDSCRAILGRLAALPLAERIKIAGLHPDRAPTIVAGVVILVAAMETLSLDRVMASENDILHGAAFEIAA